MRRTEFDEFVVLYSCVVEYITVFYTVEFYFYTVEFLRLCEYFI
jgi:hypothetical protein